MLLCDTHALDRSPSADLRTIKTTHEMPCLQLLPSRLYCLETRGKNCKTMIKLEDVKGILMCIYLSVACAHGAREFEVDSCS